MWNVIPTNLWDWASLKKDIAQLVMASVVLTGSLLVISCRCGIRNSLLLAPMPTASTAQILGNNESIEPYTSNVYSRRVLSGEFQVILSCDQSCDVIILCLIDC